jgi:hypothetical protein
VAPIIQLSQKQLVKHIRAGPKNNEVGTIWSETHISRLRDSADHGNVGDTLANVLALHPFITTRCASNRVSRIVLYI